MAEFCIRINQVEGALSRCFTREVRLPLCRHGRKSIQFNLHVSGPSSQLRESLWIQNMTINPRLRFSASLSWHRQNTYMFALSSGVLVLCPYPLQCFGTRRRHHDRWAVWNVIQHGIGYRQRKWHSSLCKLTPYLIIQV